MGCCVSSPHHPSALPTEKSQSSVTAKQQARSSVSRVRNSENRAPPPPVEEETVKEVLSETPNWKQPIFDLEPKKQTQIPVFEKTQRDLEKSLAILPVYKAEELETASEVCSLSESLSTVTVADKRDEEEEEFRQTVYGSPAKLSKNQSLSRSRRERVVGKSPTRRSEISPGRVNAGFGSGSMRFLQSRDQLSQSSIGSRNLKNEQKRRDLGEQSGRRSRSPAIRTENGAPKSVVGRTPSARRTNPSPGRIRMGQADHDGGSSVRKNQQNRKNNKWASTNESLENPLVSLECFIFL